jgi:hypothetical protein
MRFLPLLAVLLLASCAMSPIPIGLPCTVGPVILDKGASTRLTRDEQVQIVTLNNTGEQLCRWKAP